MKYKIDLKDVKVVWNRVEELPTVLRYEAFHHDFTYPICVAYTQRMGTQSNKSLALLNYLFVTDCVRRQGVGRLIHKEIQKHNDIIMTCGTTISGKIFINKVGYKFNPFIDYYVFETNRDSFEIE
jgi:hypothetical protein